MGTESLRARLRDAEGRASRAEAANRVLADSLTAAHAIATGRPHPIRLEQLPPHRRRLIEDIAVMRSHAEHLEREVERLGGPDRLPVVAATVPVDTILEEDSFVTPSPLGGGEVVTIGRAS